MGAVAVESVPETPRNLRLIDRWTLSSVLLAALVALPVLTVI